jgi:hypothetical protein
MKIIPARAARIFYETARETSFYTIQERKFQEGTRPTLKIEGGAPGAPFAFFDFAMWTGSGCHIDF